MLDGVINRVVDDIVYEAADELIQTSVRRVVEELEELEEKEAREKALEAMRRAEEAKRLEAEMEEEAETNATVSILGKIIDDVSAEMTNRIAEEEMELVEGVLLQRFVDSLGEDIQREVVADVCEELTLSVAQSCHRELVSDVLEYLTDVKSRRELRIAKSAFNKWRAIHLRKMRKMAALETLPPTPGGVGGPPSLLNCSWPGHQHGGSGCRPG